MSRKKKARTKIVRRGIKGIKVVAPEAILEREIAEEDQDLRRAKVAGIFEGFRKDREKRREELKRLREAMFACRASRQKFMLNLREKVWAKKKMMPEVRV